MIGKPRWSQHVRSPNEAQMNPARPQTAYICLDPGFRPNPRMSVVIVFYHRAGVQIMELPLLKKVSLILINSCVIPEPVDYYSALRYAFPGEMNVGPDHGALS